MSNGRVLLISYIFPPMAGGGVQRTLKFTKYLPRFGWRPEVITIAPYGPHVEDAQLAAEVPPEATVHRCYSLETRRLPRRLYQLSETRPVSRLKRLVEVPDHTMGWLPFALVAGRKAIRQNHTSVIYSSFPPATAVFVGKALKTEFGIPWVVDFRDPWTMHPWFEQRTPRVHRWLHRRLEHDCLRQADRIVVTAPSHLQQLRFAYPELPERRFSLVTNGFDEEDFSSLQVDAGTENELFTITYTGLAPDRDSLKSFLLGLRRCTEKHPTETRQWKVQLIGTNRQMADRAVSSLDLGALVETPGYIPHREALRFVGRADVLVIWSWGPNIYPAKVFEYLYARKPILALASEDDDLAKLMRKTAAGEVVLPRDVAGIANALWRLYQEKGADRTKLCLTRDELIERYERQKLTGHLATVFDEVVRQ